MTKNSNADDSENPYDDDPEPPGVENLPSTPPDPLSGTPPIEEFHDPDHDPPTCESADCDDCRGGGCFVWRAGPYLLLSMGTASDDSNNWIVWIVNLGLPAGPGISASDSVVTVVEVIEEDVEVRTDMQVVFPSGQVINPTEPPSGWEDASHDES